MKEIKNMPAIVVKADGDSITGLATVFGVIDSYGDRSHPGLFADATPRSVKFIWNHDQGSVPTATITALQEIGRADLPKSVQMQYGEASGGVLVTRTYLPTPRGQEAKAAVLAGAVTDMSYGFDAISFSLSRLPSGESIRELERVDLWEISDVALRGAVPGTMSNIAAKAGAIYAGAIRAGARHSGADRDALDRIHADVVALGATCDSSKRAPSIAELRRKYYSFQLAGLEIH